MCISYLSIEKRGECDPAKNVNLHGYVFGCDICQDVCPWNRKLEKHSIPDFKPLSDLMQMSKKEWQNLDEEKFNVLFEGSPVKRTGYTGLKRNISFLKK